tara:strand:- start:7046 stop:9637 length:2592 start_codon:yes stop_codon:yes gene_type:complete
MTKENIMLAMAALDTLTKGAVDIHATEVRAREMALDRVMSERKFAEDTRRYEENKEMEQARFDLSVQQLENTIQQNIQDQENWRKTYDFNMKKFENDLNIRYNDMVATWGADNILFRDPSKSYPDGEGEAVGTKGAIPVVKSEADGLNIELTNDYRIYKSKKELEGKIQSNLVKQQYLIDGIEEAKEDIKTSKKDLAEGYGVINDENSTAAFNNLIAAGLLDDMSDKNITDLETALESIKNEGKKLDKQKQNYLDQEKWYREHEDLFKGANTVLDPSEFEDLVESYRDQTGEVDTAGLTKAYIDLKPTTYERNIATENLIKDLQAADNASYTEIQNTMNNWASESDGAAQLEELFGDQLAAATSAMRFGTAEDFLDFLNPTKKSGETEGSFIKRQENSAKVKLAIDKVFGPQMLEMYDNANKINALEEERGIFYSQNIASTIKNFTDISDGIINEISTANAIDPGYIESDAMKSILTRVFEEFDKFNRAYSGTPRGREDAMKMFETLESKIAKKLGRDSVDLGDAFEAWALGEKMPIGEIMPIAVRGATLEAASPADSTPATAFSSWLGQDMDSGAPASFEDRIAQVIPIRNKEELSTMLNRGTIDNIDVVGAYDIIKDLSDDEVNSLIDVQSMEALQLLVGASNDGLFGPNTRLALKNASDSITAVMEELKKKEPSEGKPITISNQTLGISSNVFDMNIAQPDSVTDKALASLAKIDSNAGKREIDAQIHKNIGADDYRDAERIAMNFLNSVSRQEIEDNKITQYWIDKIYDGIKDVPMDNKNLDIAISKYQEQADLLALSFGLDKAGLRAIFKRIANNEYREQDLGVFGKDNPKFTGPNIFIPGYTGEDLDLLLGKKAPML